MQGQELGRNTEEKVKNKEAQDEEQRGKVEKYITKQDKKCFV